jgi:hypothetical protein
VGRLIAHCHSTTFYRLVWLDASVTVAESGGWRTT